MIWQLQYYIMRYVRRIHNHSNQHKVKNDKNKINQAQDAKKRNRQPWQQTTQKPRTLRLGNIVMFDILLLFQFHYFLCSSAQHQGGEFSGSNHTSQGYGQFYEFLQVDWAKKLTYSRNMYIPD